MQRQGVDEEDILYSIGQLQGVISQETETRLKNMPCTCARQTRKGDTHDRLYEGGLAGTLGSNDCNLRKVYVFLNPE